MTNLKISDSKERAGQEVNGTAIRRQTVDEHRLSELFQSYFNSKMGVLILLVQAKAHRPEAAVVNGMCFFLDDLFHHMLDASKQAQYRRTFSWLKLFLKKLPDVSVSQRNKAKDFVVCIYDAMGFHLKSNI